MRKREAEIVANILAQTGETILPEDLAELKKDKYFAERFEEAIKCEKLMLSIDETYHLLMEDKYGPGWYYRKGISDEVKQELWEKAKEEETNKIYEEDF